MICQECCQLKLKETDNCRCTVEKTYGAMYIEMVYGCVIIENNIRCKKPRMEDSYVCNMHNKKKTKKVTNSDSSKTKSKSYSKT